MGPKKQQGRPTRYRESMSVAIGVRLNAEQATAVQRACTKLGTTPSALIRDAALELVDKRLLGMRSEQESFGRGLAEGMPASLPVRFTAKQGAAVRAFCEKRRLPVATFLREAVLARVGAQNLGASRFVV